MWRDLFQRLVEDFEIHVYIDLQSYYKINTNKDETQISNKSLYFLSIKKKTKKYHTVGTISKSIIKIVERGKIDTPSTKMSIFNDDRKLFNTMSKTAN